MHLLFKIIVVIGLSITIVSCGIIHSQKSSTPIQVEFYSKGAGIDYKSKKQLEEFIVKFNETNHTNVTYTIAKKGKEGEMSFTIDSSTLSKKKNKQFHKEIKEELSQAKNCRLN